MQTVNPLHLLPSLIFSAALVCVVALVQVWFWLARPGSCKGAGRTTLVTGATLVKRQKQNLPNEGAWRRALIALLLLCVLGLYVSLVVQPAPEPLPHPPVKDSVPRTGKAPYQHSVVAVGYQKKMVMMTDRGPVLWNHPPPTNGAPDPGFVLQSSLGRPEGGILLPGIGCFFDGVMGTLSANGAMLTSFAGNQIQVRDTVSWYPYKYLVHPEPVYSIAFSPDDKLLAAGGKNGGIVLWDVASWKQVHTVQSRGEILALVFSPDGRLMATGSSNGTITLWSTKSWKPVRQWRAFSRDTWNLVFSPDGKWLLGLGDGVQEDEAVVWNTKNWKPVTQVKENGIRGGAFSPDSQRLALSKYGVPDQHSPEPHRILLYPDALRTVLHVWKTSDWSLEHTFMAPGSASEGYGLNYDKDHINHILFVTFTPENDGIIAETTTGEVDLWMLGGCEDVPESIRKDKDYRRKDKDYNGDACEALNGPGGEGCWVFRPPNTPKGWRKI